MIQMKTLLTMQNALDNSLKNSEKRNEMKIRRSAIAEAIEFDETVKETHKTWKGSEKPRQEQLEEITDVLFFLLQLVNHKNSGKEDKDYMHDVGMKKLIKAILLGEPDEIFEAYKCLAEIHGFTEEEIYDKYMQKWEFNMRRSDHNRK